MLRSEGTNLIFSSQSLAAALPQDMWHITIPHKVMARSRPSPWMNAIVALASIDFCILQAWIQEK